jgi:hypothetical protein
VIDWVLATAIKSESALPGLNPRLHGFQICPPHSELCFVVLNRYGCRSCENKKEINPFERKAIFLLICALRLFCSGKRLAVPVLASLPNVILKWRMIIILFIIIIYSTLLSLCNRLGYERPTPHLV